MGVLPGFGCAGLSRGKAKATYCGAKSSSSTVSTITHTGASIGTAAPDRYIVLFLGHRNVGGVTNNIESVTVGGVNCFGIRAAMHGSAADDPYVEIWMTSSAIPTGTTANIVVTYFGANDRHCVGVYSVTGIQKTTANTSNDSSDNGTGSITVSIAKREGGCTMAGAFFLSGSGSQTVTFGGAEIVEDAQVQVAATVANMAFASASDTTGATISVTATSSSRNSADVMAAISFYPG